MQRDNFSRQGSYIAHRTDRYFPVVLDEFKKTGLLFDVIKASIPMTGLTWRHPKQSTLAQLAYPRDQIAVHLGQNKLSAIMLKHLAKYNVPVKFNHHLASFQQTPDGVHAFIEQRLDRLQIQHSSKYLVGADGGKSTVRKALGIPFEGFSYDDFDIIASSIDYPLHDYCDWPTANFIVDPEIWGIAVQTGEDWRVTVGVRSDLKVKEEWDEEQAIKIVKDRLPLILPGPTEQARVKEVSPYTMHQRCAAKFLDGRVILAGDAAHVGATHTSHSPSSQFYRHIWMWQKLIWF
jgi:2-polyprenyl-6-methoxyphenol hydroxylase-like FAD-dependent oxidoreductase